MTVTSKHPKIIDGNKLARQMLEALKVELASTLYPGLPPGLAFIRVGEDPASISYVNKKNQVAQDLGICPRLYTFPSEVRMEAVVQCIHKLNTDPHTHGILVQAPLPAAWDSQAVFNQIHPSKDVDGFHYENLGKVAQERKDAFAPCTPLGIIALLQAINCPTQGKHVVVLGRSLTVGKPLSLLLLQKGLYGDATVSVCHSHSYQHTEALLKTADIVVAALGKPHLITADKIKAGAVVIDVGINRVEDPTQTKGYKLVGDVDFEHVLPIASAITPVPGGVGPMTVAYLMHNTLQAYKLSLE